MSCRISIDAKFDADFKNAYFYTFIFSSSRVISQKPPFLSPVASNVQKRWFFVYNSWTTQDRHIKVYIFEISIELRVYYIVCNMTCFKKLICWSPWWWVKIFHQFGPLNKIKKGLHSDLTKIQSLSTNMIWGHKFSKGGGRRKKWQKVGRRLILVSPLCLMIRAFL